MMEPDIIFIGPQRTGTTWVYNYLLQLQHICVSEKVKETFYFDRYYHRGKEWYLSHFEEMGNEPRDIAEVAPSYFHAPDVPSRIKNDLGKIHIICLLRHPLDRIDSLFRHMVRYGWIDPDASSILEHYPTFLESSRYGTHVQRWQDHFGKDRFTVLYHETLSRDVNIFAKEICDCIGIEFTGVPDNLKSNVNRATVPPSQTLAYLGWKMGDIARSFGWYNLVQLGKKIGLKRLFFGGVDESFDAKTEFPRRELQKISADLAEEMKKLEALGYEVPLSWMKSLMNVKDMKRAS